MPRSIQFLDEWSNYPPEWLCHFTFHCQRLKGPVSPHPRQHLVVSLFFLLALPVGVKCYLIMVCILISLRANDREHLVTCFFVANIVSLVKCLMSIGLFLIGLFMCFFTIEFWGFFTYSKYRSFVWYVAWTCFSPRMQLSFHPFHGIFHRVKFWILRKFNLLITIFCMLNSFPVFKSWKSSSLSL